MRPQETGKNGKNATEAPPSCASGPDLIAWAAVWVAVKRKMKLLKSRDHLIYYASVSCSFELSSSTITQLLAGLLA